MLNNNFNLSKWDVGKKKTNVYNTDKNFNLRNFNSKARNIIKNNKINKNAYVNAGEKKPSFKNSMNNTINSYNVNNDTKKFMKNALDIVYEAKDSIDNVNKWWKSIPNSIKITNIIVSVIITYVFTYHYYNIYLSVGFSILTFLMILPNNKFMAYIFYMIYLLLITKIILENKRIYGYPIKETIISNNTCYEACSGSSVQIPAKDLDKIINTNNSYTYTFWLYIYGYNKNNSINDYSKYNTYNGKNIYIIFYRGNITMNSGSISSMTCLPLIYLVKGENNLYIDYISNGSVIQTLKVENIEMDKWFNITLVMDNLSISIYKNGKLLITNIKDKDIVPPYQYNLNILTEKNVLTKYGFPGKLSYLIYYSYILEPEYIYKMYNYYKYYIDKYESKKTIKYDYPALIENNSKK